jgi:prepilin-type N-terminal cleavage/methylation domain-containing protein/prepilin-type processing-associated H-X9-DG protein
MAKTRDNNAFTLVELLVVISIIALLLAILMPTLNKVRLQAQKVACTSQMRQIGLAFVLYGSQNNDRFPSFDKDMKTSTAYDNWCLMISPMLGGVIPDAALGKAVKNSGVFQCPSHKGPRNANNNVERTYCTNVSERRPWEHDWTKEGGYGVHRMRFAQVKHASDVAALFDIQWSWTDYRLPLYKSETGIWGIQYNQNMGDGSMVFPPGTGKSGSVNSSKTKPETAPHSDRNKYITNVSYVDGHAGSVPYINDDTGVNRFQILPQKLFYLD